MPDSTDSMRHLVIRAATEHDLIEKLGEIPGYTCLPLEPDVQRRIGGFSDVNRFYLRADTNGERIVVCHRAGEAEAQTSNVMDQDERGQIVAIWNDELAVLYRAIKQVEGLSAYIIAAEIDLLPPSS